MREAALALPLLGFVLLSLAACKGDPAPAAPRPPPTVCNGHAELCLRAYDKVAFPGTHDAYSDVADGFGAPDQTNTLTKQLEDGVRVLHLEIRAYRGDVDVCHGYCIIGQRPLADVFAEIDAFVGAHPDEVVTLLMESSDVTTDDIATRVQASGLGGSVHTQAAGSPWPTLSQMIENGDRVVLLLADLTQTGGGSYPWLLPRWGFTWETPWDNEKPSDFTRCNADRGTMGNDLYVVDTYVEGTVIPTVAEAMTVNVNPFLIGRLLHCQAAEKTLPSFVMVNYYEVGDLFRDVDALNGLAPVPDAGVFPPGDAGTADAADGD